MHLARFAKQARKGYSPELEYDKYVEDKCVVTFENNIIEGTTQNLYFPIVVNRGARQSSKVWTGNSWDAVAADSNLGWAVKLAVLMTEDEKAGFDALKVDKLTATNKYRALVIDYALNNIGRLKGKAKAEFVKNLRKTKLIEWETYADVQHATDILINRKHNQNRDIEAVFGPIGQEDAGVAVDGLTRQLDHWRNALRQNSARGVGFGTGIWFQHAVPGANGLCRYPGLTAKAPPHMVQREVVPILPLQQQQQEDIGEAQEAQPDRGQPLPAPPMSEKLQEMAERDPCAKIFFSLTRIPLRSDDGTNQDMKLYMLRLNVVDPTINISDWLFNTMQDVRVQDKHIMAAMVGGGNKRRTPVEYRFPAHDIVADTGHPAYNLTDERYVRCAAEFYNDANILTQYCTLTNADIYPTTAVLNPCNVFSFANTRRILVKYGASPDALGNLNTWMLDRTTATFPTELTTFLYPPESVFWVDRAKLGLMERVFPQKNNTTELYAAIARGDPDLEQMVALELQRRRALTGEHDPQTLLQHARPDTNQQGSTDEDLFREERNTIYDQLTQREREALSARIIHRMDVKNQRMATYETDNRFVHFALERDMVYANLGKFYPQNAIKTLEKVGPIARRYRNHWLNFLQAEDHKEYTEVVGRAGTAAEHESEAWARYIVNESQRERMLQVFRQHRGDWKAELIGPDLTLYEDVERYEQYRLLLSVVQTTCMERFSQLWVMDGRVDNLPISDGCKAVLKFLHKTLGDENGDRIITRQLLRKDKDLSFFATSLTKLMVIFSRVARIVQPKVQILAEGLQSCYDWHPGEINFHILVHGRYDMGKTYQLLSTLINFTAIEGRVKEETRATGAAKDSGNHIYDLTWAKDEIPDYFTSSSAQEKNAEQTNQLKQRMTRKQSHLTAFEAVVMPDGSTQRGTRNYVTDDYSSMACVTNNGVEPTGALTSRFFCLVMKDVGVGVLETMFDVQKKVKGNTREYVHLIEYHCASAKKAAMCGAIQKDVNMDLWQDVCNRMIEYLEKNGLIPKDKGYRPMQIMVPFLRQYVYHRAAMLTWNIPGAPHYNQPYDVSQIQTMQRFLYVDLQTILFIWTLLGSQYVDGDNGEVLGAAVRLAGIRDWADGVSAYDMYVNRRGEHMPFRRYINPAYLEEQKRARQNALSGGGGGGDDGPAMDKRDKWMLDLNYVTVEGQSYDMICQQISEKTNSFHRIAPIDVKGILSTLAKSDPMQPPRNGYKPQPEGSFDRLHGLRIQPDGQWTKAAFDGKVYEEDDVPPLKPITENMTIPAVIIEKPDRLNGRWKVHVAPWAIEHFREKIIVEAFNHVVMTPSHPRKKMLVGWTYPRDPSVFQVMNYAKEGAVERLCEHYAAAEGDRPEGYTRKDGVIFARYQYNTPSELIELSEQMQGVKYVQPEQPFELVSDLEVYSASSQHVLCGRPLDMPIETPAEIEARYERACRELNIQSSFKNYVYPVNNLQESRGKRAKYEAVSGSSKPSARQRALTQRLMEEELSMDSLLEAEEQSKMDRRIGKMEEGYDEDDLELVSLLDSDVAQEPSSKRARTDTRSLLLDSLTNDG